MGDDKVDEHVFKFVTAGRFDPGNRAANMDLLDKGVLSPRALRPMGRAAGWP